ncbi:ABC transporter permease subunit [Ottowia sp. VDI28]|uniref:branched-chain amino acid ABC transporter ATP-binding protein/permease n=1 Tax=Ottowia sp. VDI28 TaxID=3133968 RepID=UPI003C300F88
MPATDSFLKNYGGIAAVLAIGLLLAFGLGSAFHLNLLTIVVLWMVLALSWNLVSGYAALVSFGHAVFFGLGAYAIVLLQLKFQLSPWLGLPLATLLGAAAGALIGVITLRLSGVYFALAMLCYPMALIYLFEYLGLQEVTVPMHREAPLWFMQFQSQRSYVFLALGLLAVALVLCKMIERSRFGLWLRAIKQNEPAALALGVHCFRWKLLALTLSGGLGAAAGALYAQVVLVVTPTSVFGMAVSAQALVLTLFGGLGTLWGPVIGAVLLVPLAELLKHELGAQLPGINGVIFGAIVIATVLLAPRGIFWRVREALGRKTASDPYSEPGESPPLSVSTVPALSAQAAPREAGQAGTPLLRVEGLKRAFGGVTAADNVSFEVRRGEILGVIGPNGAGKTTLMNLVNGYIAADAGSVLLDGAELLGQSVHEVARSGVGRTFQVARVFPDMTLFGNVAVGALAGPASGDWRAATWRALDLVGLQGRADVLAGQATARDLRLMELARAASQQPRLILVDECLAGLSSDDVEEMVTALLRLRDAGTTIMIIEHTMHAMLRLADRFLVLDHGCVIADGEPRAVMQLPQVLEAYLGRRFAEGMTHA